MSDIDDYVTQLVADAPPLAPSQRDRLAGLLRSTAPPDSAEFEAQVEAERRRREATEREEKARREAAEEARRAAARRTALYRHFDANGVLLYVGVSKSSDRRRSEHVDGKAAWMRFQASEAVEWLTDRATAETAEVVAIEHEQPVFNVMHAAEGARERRLRYLVDHGAWDMLQEAK